MASLASSTTGLSAVLRLISSNDLAGRLSVAAVGEERASVLCDDGHARAGAELGGVHPAVALERNIGDAQLPTERLRPPGGAVVGEDCGGDAGGVAATGAAPSRAGRRTGAPGCNPRDTAANAPPWSHNLW